MSTVENYDGLCGIISLYASSGKQVRCQYEFGHHGPCSFRKHKHYLTIHAGAICAPDPDRGFIDSVLSHQEK